MKLYKLHIYFSFLYLGIGLFYARQNNWTGILMVGLLFFFSTFLYFAGKENQTFVDPIKVIQVDDQN